MASKAWLHGQASLRSLAAEGTLIVLAVVAYFGVRGLTEGSADLAIANAERVIELEMALLIAVEARLQDALLVSKALVNLVNWIYIWGHWPVIAVVAVWLFFHDPPRYRLYRNAFLVSGAIGLIIFALFPVAPPRLLDLGTIDTVTLYSRAYRVLQPPVFVNQYAAMPSLHLGWDLLICIALFQSTRLWALRAFALLLPPAMFAAIVLTANHYVVDGVAGVTVALVGLGIAYWHRNGHGFRFHPKAIRSLPRYPDDDGSPTPPR